MNQNDQIASSPSEAKKLGLTTYYTGNPCLRGHLSERVTASAGCAECLKIKARKRNSKKKAKARKKKLRKMKSKPRPEGGKHGIDVSMISDAKERKREYSNQYYHRNKDRIKELSLRECRANKRKEYIRSWQCEYRKTKEGKAISFMRKCISRCIKNKMDTTEEYLGYKKRELIERISGLFTHGMTWDNYGDWHIDHIKPINAFLKEGVEDVMIINALSNLQPLWAKDNLRKGDKF